LREHPKAVLQLIIRNRYKLDIMYLKMHGTDNLKWLVLKHINIPRESYYLLVDINMNWKHHGQPRDLRSPYAAKTLSLYR